MKRTIVLFFLILFLDSCSFSIIDNYYWKMRKRNDEYKFIIDYIFEQGYLNKDSLPEFRYEIYPIYKNVRTLDTNNLTKIIYPIYDTIEILDTMIINFAIRNNIQEIFYNPTAYHEYPSKSPNIVFSKKHTPLLTPAKYVVYDFGKSTYRNKLNERKKNLIKNGSVIYRLIDTNFYYIRENSPNIYQ
jgi:hypothetical protein